MMRNAASIQFLQTYLPRLALRWQGFRKVCTQVVKRLKRRLRTLQLPDLSAYEAYLASHAEEWVILDSMCRISISRFYRVVYLYRAGNSVACKTGIMPPFHHHIRGQRDGITPLFLPAGAVGSALALLHVALCVAL
jgi:hypothetical protein